MNVLYSLQHGFRSGHSTIMSLVDIQNHISQAIDSKKFSMGIFLDLSKAFDTVDHDILLKKWKIMGSVELLSTGLKATFPHVYIKSNVTTSYLALDQ